MNPLAAISLPEILMLLTTSWSAKAAFIGAFLLLILVLICLPRRLTGGTEAGTPWWRNVRTWAILIALSQIILYAWWG